MTTLVKQISAAFRRFPEYGRLGPPTRLHVSSEIYAQLWSNMEKTQQSLGHIPRGHTLYCHQCPVVEISDMDGFRWIRERPNSWDTGPMTTVEMSAMKPDAPFELTPKQADTINTLLPTCEYVVGIRHNESGKVRFCPMKLKWEEHSLSWWNTGNFSCDCNRHLEFHGYTDSAYEDNIPCGETMYTVVGIWFLRGGDIRDLNQLNDF